MNRRSILPQKGKVVKDKFTVKSTARKSLSIPENARKKRNYIEKKKEDVEDDIKNSSRSWEDMEAGSSSSSLTWMDYLPSDTYHSDSEESSTSTLKTSSVSDTSPIEDTRSRATYFAEDFDDIVQTVDGYLNLDEDIKGPEKRTVMSLDVSEITTSAMKDPKRMSKFLPKLTSTLLHGSKSGISINTGGENSEITFTNQESNVKPSNNKGPEDGLSPDPLPLEMRLLSKISEPEEPAPPCMDNSLIEELKIPDTFPPRNNAFEIEQQSKDYLPQVLGVSRHEKRISNYLNKSSTEKALVHENVLSIVADQASQRQKILASKKIRESERNGKQKNFKGPEKRASMSLDASNINTSTMKEYPNKMSKFVPKFTSSLLHGSKSRISIDAGGEISEIMPASQKSNVKPSNSKGPEVGLSPERISLEMRLLSDQRSQRRKIPSSKKIHESRRNGKQKRIPESAEPPFMEDTMEELRIPNACGIQLPKERRPLPPSTEKTSTESFSTKSKTFENKHSAKNYEFQIFEDIQSVSKYEKESFNILNTRPIEHSRNLTKEKNLKLGNSVPICPLFDLFQMNPNTRLKELPLKQKPSKHRDRKAIYENVDICPLEIAPVSGSGLRQIQLVSSKENQRN